MYEFTAFNAATATGSSRLGIRGFDTAEVEIYGTATSATVRFRGASKSGIDRDRMGLNMADFSTGLTGSIGTVYQINISGLDSLLLDITAITGGNVSVNVRCF